MRPVVKPTSSRIWVWTSHPAATNAGVIRWVQTSRSLRLMDRLTRLPSLQP